MKKYTKMSMLLKASIGLLFLLSSFSVLAIDSQSRMKTYIDPETTSVDIPYEGHLRVYVTEPVSRWRMYDQQPYHFGSLGFAADEDLSIEYQQTFTKSYTWNGDAQEDNVLVIAAVYNPEPHLAYAYPPQNNPFEAHYVDAAAGAKPGQTSYNTVNENFTHTVFAEEATATWCQYCPAMGHALSNIYDSGDYPFFYVALIDDKSPGASYRIDEFNTAGFPTAFFDGGYKVFVGGESSESPYRTRIKQCAKLDVHEMNLSLSVQYLGDGDLKIDINITNNEEILMPIIEIGNVTGGKSVVKADAKNVGNGNAEDIAWSITVKGGLLGRINVSDSGTIDIPAGNKVDLSSTSRIFGLGKIQITVTVGGATKNIDAFILGPFIIIK